MKKKYITIASILGVAAMTLTSCTQNQGTTTTVEVPTSTAETPVTTTTETPTTTQLPTTTNEIPTTSEIPSTQVPTKTTGKTSKTSTSKSEVKYLAYYTVEHYLQNDDGTYGEAAKKQSKSGYIGDLTEASALTFDGYSVTSFEQSEIAKDGSTTIKIYYDLVQYHLSIGTNSVCGMVEGEGDYTASNSKVRCSATPYIGYEFKGWYDGDTLLSNKKVFTYTVTGEKEITAAFEKMDELKGFEFESTLTTCKLTGVIDSSVTSLSIPAVFTEIQSGALKNCKNLEALSLGFTGTSATATGKDALFASLFSSEDYDGAHKSTAKYKENKTWKYLDYYVPKTLKTVEYTGTEIKSYAFSGADFLDSISIENAKTIGEYAFYKSGIVSIHIPESTTKIADYAFEENSHLVEAINDSIVSFEYSMYSGHLGFDSYLDVHTSDLASKVIYEDGFYYYYDGSYYTIIKYSGNDKDIIIPKKDNPISIMSYAFEGVEVDSLDTGESINTLNLHALAGLTVNGTLNLSNVSSFAENALALATVDTLNIPKVNAVYKGIFNDLAVRKIVLNDKVSALNSSLQGLSTLEEINLDHISYIDEDSFYECYSLKNVDLSNVVNIGDNAFRSCGIENVKLGSGITSITNGMFSGIDTLKSINLENVQYLGWGAFYNCSSLEEVNLSSYMDTEIPSDAFSGCSSLKKVTLSNAVTSINTLAFYNCTSLEEINLDNIKEIKISAFYNCESLKAISLPSIEDIASSSFCNSGIKSISLGDNYKSIAASAFIDMSDLEEINLGNIETIGNYAFRGCTSLKKLDLRGLTSLSSSALYGVDALEEIILGEKLTEIESYTFSNTSLKKINLNYVETIYDSAFYYSKLEGEIDLSNVTYIGNSAFSGTNITKVSMPKVTSIGKSAFNGCDLLEEVVLPEAEYEIKDNAFSYCYRLKTMDLSHAKKIGSYAFTWCESIEALDLSGVTSLSSNAFYACAGVKSLTLGSGLSTISKGAFSYCHELQKVEIPSGVTTIEFGAFSRCFSLEIVSIPDTVTTIEENAFGSCSKLREVFDFTTTNPLNIACGSDDYGGVAKYAIWVFHTVGAGTTIQEYNGFSFVEKLDYCECIGYSGDEEEIVFPASLNGKKYKIHSGFRMSENVKSVTIGDGVIEICDSAFEDSKLEKVTITGKDLTTIGESAFAWNYSLKDITLNEGLVDIGKYAFSEAAIKNITLPKTVKTLGDYALAYCYSLWNLELNEGLTTIGESAFEECNLCSIIIPSTITSIGDNAFDYLSNLKEITDLTGGDIVTDYPNCGLASLGDLIKKTSVSDPSVIKNNGTFIYYDNGETITILSYIGDDRDFVVEKIDNKETEIASYAFQNLDVDSITVSSDIKKISDGAFSNSMVKSISILGATSIGDYAFYYCEELTNVSLSKTLTDIGECAFMGCSSLESITLPNSVATIGTKCFNYCSKLKDIKLSSSLTEIPNNTFNSCDSLEAIELPLGIKIIGDNAFDSCSKLTNVKLSDSLIEIGESAFYYTNIKEIKLPDGLLTIKDSAFMNTEIEEIEIPSSVTTFGKDVFKYSSLSKITMPCNLSDDTIGDVSSFIGEYVNTIIITTGKIVQANAFVKTNVHNLVLPDTVETIQQGALSSLYYLEDLYIPFVGESRSASANTTKALFGYIFGTTSSSYGYYDTNQYYNYSNYSTYNIPYNLTTVTVGEAKLEYGAFNNVTLNSLILGDVSYINGDAFTNCHITTLDFVDSIGAIKENGFYSAKITNLYLPKNVGPIEMNAFYDAVIDYTYYKGEIKDWCKLKFNATSATPAYSGCNLYYLKNAEFIPAKGTIVIPSDVTSIGDYQFAYWQDITAVVFENGTKTIGVRAFIKCDELRYVILPESITKISKDAFNSLANLKNVKLYGTLRGENDTLYPYTTFDNAYALRFSEDEFKK